MKHIIFVLFLTLISFQYSFSQKIDKGYYIYKSEKLENTVNGINGYLQILLDEKFKSDELRDYSPMYNEDYLKSILQVVDVKGKPLLIENIDYPVTDLEKVYLYGDIKPTYLITVNNYAGAGRETGHLTFFIEIENAEMKYVLAKDGLQNSLGSGWIIDIYKKEKNKQIFYVEGRLGEDDQNVLILKRYFFDGNEWNFKEKIINYEWWENGENEFPPISIFP